MRPRPGRVICHSIAGTRIVRRPSSSDLSPTLVEDVKNPEEDLIIPHHF